jgi:hypothetical protein
MAGHVFTWIKTSLGDPIGGNSLSWLVEQLISVNEPNVKLRVLFFGCLRWRKGDAGERRNDE